MSESTAHVSPLTILSLGFYGLQYGTLGQIKICVFQVTWNFKIGTVGSKTFLFC